MRETLNSKLLALSSSNGLTLSPKSGFTLVEIILYMALVTIFTLTLTDIFVAILDVKTESEATSAVEQDGRFILARLAYDINRATTITNPLNLGDSTSSLTITVSVDTYDYSLNNGNLQINSNNLNSSETSISNLQFTKMGNIGGKETISVQFTITSKTQRPSGPETRNFNTTIGRR